MQLYSKLTTRTAITILLFAFLSGCAPTHEVTYKQLDSNLYANLNFDPQKNIVIQYSENEPEVALEEELSALDKVGDWEVVQQP